MRKNSTQRAFMLSKNDKISPGWSFDRNNNFMDMSGHVLPVNGGSISVSMSKVNDEPADIKVETTKITPKGIIRHRKNFTSNRKLRAKHKNNKKHVQFIEEDEDSLSSDPYVNDTEEESSIRGLARMFGPIPFLSEEDEKKYKHINDWAEKHWEKIEKFGTESRKKMRVRIDPKELERERELYNEKKNKKYSNPKDLLNKEINHEMKKEIDSEYDYSDDENILDIKLQKAGFSPQKINVIKKIIFE